MFQTKSFLAITASMVNRMRLTCLALTDYSVGAVARTMVEAPAQELDELYQQMIAGIIEAVPVSVYRSFNFADQPEEASSGLIRVTITVQPIGVVIPSLTSFSQPFSQIAYASSVDALIPAGNTYVDVAVVAATAGSAGNIGAATVFTPSNVPAGFLTATNLNAFITGTDTETPDAKKTRFNDFIQTLSRATLDAILFGTRDQTYLVDSEGNQIERVLWVSVVEPYLLDKMQPVGLVLVYIHNGTGGTSAALVARAVQILHGYQNSAGVRVPGYKAAGVQVNVAPATEVPVPFTATLTALNPLNQAALVAAAGALIAAYALGLPIGEPFIVARAIELAMDMVGMENFVPASGTADVPGLPSVKLMPGLLSIA